MRTLVIIPAFNEEKNIKQLIEDVDAFGYEYLILNDCSTDHTEEILRQNNYNYLSLPVNAGIAGVTWYGFKYAYENGYDCAICVDGDGQHQPKYIKTLIDEIEKGSDYVVGSRFIEKAKPHSMRMLGSRIICFFIKTKTGKTVYDPTSGMRALGKKVLEDFSKDMNFYAEPDALCYLLSKGYNVKEVQVEMNERLMGESYFTNNPLKSIRYMISVLISIILIR